MSCQFETWQCVVLRGGRSAESAETYSLSGLPAELGRLVRHSIIVVAVRKRRASAVTEIHGHLDLIESLIEIMDNVNDVFNANSNSDHVRRDSRRDLFLLSELLVRSRAGVDHERLGITNIGKVASELDAFNKLLPALESTLDTKCEHRTKAAVTEVLSSNVVVLVLRHASKADPGNLRMRLQVLS